MSPEMSPQAGLEFLKHWTLEIMPAKFVPTFNDAVVAVSRAIAKGEAEPAQGPAEPEKKDAP